jgi:hypothetical protein
MQIRWRSAASVAIVLALGALAAGAATAAGPDDRASAASVLKDVEASPRKAVAAEMIARARAAEERASKLRAAGDEPRARLADGLAKTWAEAARDVLRAADVEQRADLARRSATDAGAVADRERALLEEGIAQTGRLRAQLEAAPREGKEQPARTSAAANTDAGIARPAPRAPATKDGGAK